MSLETFVEAALYAPRVGYYRRARERVGYRAQSDFYTAESLGGVFAELVVAAVETLLPPGAGAAAFTFVELGAERGEGMLADREHPFRAAEARGAGEDWRLEGPCVVFSNELFDAQPFRRFEVIEGEWREHGVRLDAGGFTAVLLPPGDAPPSPGLPPPPREGYLYDLPSGANALLRHLTAQPWHGLFLAFDYGLDRETLATARPGGTARTYRHHQTGGDLLAHPGETDLTHHICWDDLSGILADAGFTAPRLESQETLFMRRARAAVERIVALGARPGVHPELQTLKELLHPHHMGRRFQALHAFRANNPCQPDP
ncbi:MAG: SAM-dependent methyltransferase [Opitutales bacterium]